VVLEDQCRCVAVVPVRDVNRHVVPIGHRPPMLVTQLLVSVAGRLMWRHQLVFQRRRPGQETGHLALWFTGRVGRGVMLFAAANRVDEGLFVQFMQPRLGQPDRAGGKSASSFACSTAAGSTSCRSTTAVSAEPGGFRTVHQLPVSANSVVFAPTEHIHMAQMP